MNDLILFLLKSIGVSGLLTAWYVLAFKNKPQHKFNRFLLLFILYASLQVPLLRFTWPASLENTPLSVSTAKMVLSTPQEINSAAAIRPAAPAHHLDFTIIVLAITIGISTVLLARMLFRIMRVVRMRKQYPSTELEGATLLHTDLPNAPFSFLKFIFWNDSIPLETANGKLVLQHELAHIQQRHSYDKLFSQALNAIFWMNPFFWIIRRELNIVHEFLADEQAIVKGNQLPEEDYTETLAKMLLHRHGRHKHFALEHHFFSSPIKRRIIMLQSANAQPTSFLTRITILPLLAACTLLFSFSPSQKVKKADKALILVVDAGHGGIDEGCKAEGRIEKDLNLKIARRIRQLAPRYNISVHLTRDEDKYMTLQERVAFSNKVQPDGFLSIHITTYPKDEKNLATFDVAVNLKHAKADESKKLAYAILSTTSRPGWIQKNRSAEQNSYAVLKGAAASALIEIGNINNQEQMQYIEDDKKLDELCSNILAGVLEAHR